METPMTVKSLKVVLLGDSGVGKTCLMNRFAMDIFDAESKTTAGASFLTKTVDFLDHDTQIKYEIWDTAGQEKYKSMVKLFYKDAGAIIFVYSIDRQHSYDELVNYWSKEILQNAKSDVILCVAANKSDLFEDEVVNETEAREFAKSIKAGFALTSAKTKVGVESLFQYIGEKYFNPDSAMTNNDHDEKKGQHLKPSIFNKDKKKKCC